SNLLGLRTCKSFSPKRSYPATAEDFAPNHAVFPRRVTFDPNCELLFSRGFVVNYDFSTDDYHICSYNNPSHCVYRGYEDRFYYHGYRVWHYNYYTPKAIRQRTIQDYYQYFWDSVEDESVSRWGNYSLYDALRVSSKRITNNFSRGH
ncbi:hypothetical protein CVT26_013081, partial [Gymnopilus dilepis]